MNTSKIIKGVVGGSRYTVTAPIMKEDYGLYLQIEGCELPSTYEVDFSNDEHCGTSVTMIGDENGVLIPSQFISDGKDVFAFYYHVGADYGRTTYKFRIPNKCRPDRTNEQPIPEQQSTIDQAIAALNSAVEQTAADVESADASAQSAAESAETATAKASEAAASEAQAGTYAGNAAQFAVQSAASAQASAQSASAASQSAQSAYADAERAEQAAAQSGYMFFYIDENGDLHYQRTDNVDVDFYLSNGDLYVRAGT